MRQALGARLAAVVVTAFATVACSGTSGADHAPSGRTGKHHRAGHPQPTRTIVRNARVLHAGQSATFTAQRGVALRFTVGRPAYSRTRLSPNYGYAPAHGYYVSLTITIRNTGRVPVPVGPRYFFLTVPDQGRVTSYDGNSPYSGASQQLDTTQLDPGRTISAPLTFDVSGRHGRLAYAPDASPALIWTF